VDVDDSSTSDSQNTVRLRTQFVEWFAAANHEDAIENLALCFVDDGYGYLDIDDPRDAAQLLTVLLRNQLEPEAYCTWEIDGDNYYLDSGYINPATKKIIRRPLTSIVGVGSRDYANLLFELAGVGLLDVRWHIGEYNLRTVALHVGIDVLAGVWQSETPAGRAAFSTDGYIYILGASEFYKIGRAKNLDSRIKQLAVQLPWPVDVVHAIPCEDYVAAEKELHKRFAARRANGEWFRLTSEDLEWTKGIVRMRGQVIERQD
jgi:hypothetical protein